MSVGILLLCFSIAPRGSAWAAEAGTGHMLLSVAVDAGGALDVEPTEVQPSDPPPAVQSEPAAEETSAAPSESPPEQQVDAASPPPAETMAPVMRTESQQTAAPHDPAPAAAAGPSRPAYGVGRYTVARGDTMFSIARKVEISLGALSAVNNIADPGSVKAGQVLYIPAQPGAVHVASKGDTVQSIADQYQSRQEVIREANRLDKAARLDVGQLILVPGNVQPSTASARPSVAPAQTTSVQVSASGGISPLPAPKSAQALTPPTAAALPRAPQGGRGDTLIWPVIGPLSTLYSQAHRAIDIVANQGMPVKSALAGRVVGAAEGDGPYGWYVIVEHGGAFTTVYAHLSKIRVKVGDVVDKGQVVGDVGNTGQSTGPHLHFEVRQSNVPIDPRPYLP